MSPASAHTGVSGTCDPAFAGVRESLAANLADGEDLGAAVAVFVDGEPVVDLWGGTADLRSGREWVHDTACVTFSCTKAVTAAAALLLDERGVGSLAAPVTDWWPEFAAHGKDGITGHHLLTHTAGLPAFERPVSSDEAADPEAMAMLLAGQAPAWEPGTEHGYHALTYGWLVGEFVRRHAQTSVREFVRTELGADLTFGVGQDELGSVARMAAARTPTRSPPVDGPLADPDTIRRVAEAGLDATSPMRRSTANPAANFGKPVVLSAGWPAAGLITTARGLGGFFARLLDGRLLAPATLQDAVLERVRGADRTMITETAFGLGFMRPSATMRLPPAARDGSFGHLGASGALGVADPSRGVAIAYVPNLIRGLDLDRRAYRIVDAVYSVTG